MPSLGHYHTYAQISAAIVWSKLVSVVFPLYLIIKVNSAKVLSEWKQRMMVKVELQTHTGFLKCVTPFLKQHFGDLNEMPGQLID